MSNPVVLTPTQVKEDHTLAVANARQPEDISGQLQQVVQLILFYCDKYGATEELLSLEEVNVPAFEGLIEKYEVSADDRARISSQVLLIVLDLMGRLEGTWYTIWNDTVKPALQDIVRRRGA